MLRLGSIAKAVLRGCAFSCVLLAGVCCRAQQDQTPVFTLKVYANLIQVPTLVLDHDRQPLRRIDPSRFRVSLDGGKKFAPTRVRIEGEDPLDVAILLDMSGSQRHLISSFGKATGKMADSLRPQDRVSVYALNCELVRSAQQIVPQPELISRSVEAALSAPALNEGYSHGACPKQLSLWNAMTRIVHEMSDSPARRVMLVVSEGDVRGFVSWEDLHGYAADHGVALFGVNDGFAYTYDPLRNRQDDPFRRLCESTGGVVMHSEERDLEERLQKWVTMLRGRYVIEFPRPQQIGEGMHSVAVSIKGDSLAFVTLAGVGVSLPDPSLANDPHYVPSQAGADIPVGTKRPVEH
jgi:hypothetical protein